MRLCLAVLLGLAASARAGYEESGFSARAVAMGSAFTAVHDDISAMAFNPASTGRLRRVQLGSNYLRQFHIPAGETDQNQMSLAAAFPVQQELIRGTFGLGWLYSRRQREVIERSLLFNFGSRGLREFEDSGLELGGTIRVLGVRPKGSVDVGALYSFWEKYALGFSVLNLNRPLLEGGRAPATAKLGFAESVGGLTLAMDLTKREPSGQHGASSSFGAGLEHWWATARQGSFAWRTGLVLGEPAKTWNWGLGWRILGGQLDYAMTVPLSGRSLLGHGLSLLFRFGESNPEREYERMLAEEVRSRKELRTSLEAGEVKQWKLSEELRRLREEIEVLRGELGLKEASENQAQERLRALEERHQRALQNFERQQAERKRLSERTKETLFKEDWASYNKLKAGAAPDAVLLEHARRLLREYKDSGVDLGEANQELLRLLRSQ